jgi:hypothetical protein
MASSQQSSASPRTIERVTVSVGNNPAILGKLVIRPHGLINLRFESRLEAEVVITLSHELVV